MAVPNKPRRGVAETRGNVFPDHSDEMRGSSGDRGHVRRLNVERERALARSSRIVVVACDHCDLPIVAHHKPAPSTRPPTRTSPHLLIRGSIAWARAGARP